MRDYHEFSALYFAPQFRKDFFQDVALNWKGLGLRYLMLLVLLVCLFQLIMMTISFNSFLTYELPATIKDFPRITISDGIATCTTGRYALYSNNQALFVFDDAWNPAAPFSPKAPLVMTKTELVLCRADGTETHRSLKSLPIANSTINRAWINEKATTFRDCLIPVGLLLLGLPLLIYRFVLALLFGLLGKPLCGLADVDLPFRARVRLATVSMTAPLALDTLLGFLGFGGMPVFVLVHGLTLVSLFLAIRACAEVAPAPPNMFPPKAVARK